jgi:hypothetical protein
MLMVWDSVSELWPPTGLLFIPQMIYGEHEEPWWNDIRVIQKVRFPIFYLNKITTYTVTHEAEIRSDISFTSPHSHQVCLDTYQSDISICQVLHRKKMSWAHNSSWLRFKHLHWSGSADLWDAFSSLEIQDGSLTVRNQDCMMGVEEFPSPRI